MNYGFQVIASCSGVDQNEATQGLAITIWNEEETITTSESPTIPQPSPGWSSIILSMVLPLLVVIRKRKKNSM
jgi:hypothetical protein